MNTTPSAHLPSCVRTETWESIWQILNRTLVLPTLACQRSSRTTTSDERARLASRSRSRLPRGSGCTLAARRCQNGGINPGSMTSAWTGACATQMTRMKSASRAPRAGSSSVARSKLCSVVVRSGPGSYSLRHPPQWRVDLRSSFRDRVKLYILIEFVLQPANRNGSSKEAHMWAWRHMKGTGADMLLRHIEGTSGYQRSMLAMESGTMTSRFLHETPGFSLPWVSLLQTFRLHHRPEAALVRRSYSDMVMARAPSDLYKDPLILRMARSRSVASVPNSLVVACGRCAVGSSRGVVYVLFFFSLSCLQLASFSLLCVDELFM